MYFQYHACVIIIRALVLVCLEEISPAIRVWKHGLGQARSQQFAKGGSTVDISAIDRTYIFIYMYIIYNYVAWYVNRTICMRI